MEESPVEFENTLFRHKREDVENLKEKHEKAHSLCLQKVEQWEKFREDYKILKSKLETLPERISYEIMVPFGSHAFIPGHLIHTNEVMALLGVNWFAEVSARHAAEISNRRMEQCEKTLKDLKMEKEQCENWLYFISQTMSDDLVDIAEPWIEENEKLWNDQHLKNVKLYKQREAGISLPPDNVSKEVAEASDKDYFQILDNLEKQESYDGELDENISHEVHNGGHKFDNFYSSDESDTEEKKDEDNSDEYHESNGKHVKWKDQEGEKMKNCITFTHSSRKCKNRSSTKPVSISKTKSKAKDHVPLSPIKIQSPSDIYKCFATKAEQSKPKSILKRRTSVDDNDVLTESENECATIKNEGSVPICEMKFKVQNAFTGEIVEHEMDKTVGVTSHRPPSQFKTQRQNKQR